MLAQDSAGIDATSTIVQVSASANTTAGLLDIVRNLLPSDVDYTSASGTRAISDGTRVYRGVSATGTGDEGSIYEYVGDLDDQPDLVDLKSTNYANTALWDKLDPEADQPGSIFNGIANVNVTTSDARAIGGLAMLNDVAQLRPRLHRERWRDRRITERGGAGAVAAHRDRGGQGRRERRQVQRQGHRARLLRPDRDQPRALRRGGHDSDSSLDVTDALVVHSENHSALDARLLSATASGDTALAFMIAFNSLGWLPINVLFNAIDTLLGDPILSEAFGGEQPAMSTALIEDTDIVGPNGASGAGEVTIDAVNGARVNATVSNAASSTACALFGATGKSIGGVLASNKVSSGAEAAFVDGNAVVDGDFRVAASDETGIFSNVKMVSSSITTNDGGASIIQGAINTQVDSDFNSSEGMRDIRLGQRVRLASDYGSPALRLRRRESSTSSSRATSSRSSPTTSSAACRARWAGAS